MTCKFFGIALGLLVCAATARAGDPAPVGGNSSGETWRQNLSLSGEGGYSALSIFGQGSVPEFRGYYWGAGLEYKFASPSWGFAPFFGYRRAQLSNTANGSSFSEKLTLDSFQGGLRIYSGNLYAGLGWTWIKFHDAVSGTLVRDVSYSSSGPELNVGAAFDLSPFLRFGVNLGGWHVSVKTGTLREDYFSYSAGVSLTLLLPSYRYYFEAK